MQFTRRLLTHSVLLALLQGAAMLVGIQLRVQILPFGETLGEGYVTFPSEAILIIVLASCVGALLTELAPSGIPSSLGLTGWFHMAAHLLVTALTAGAVYYFLPQLSQLQLVYFAVFAVFVGWLFLLLPRAFMKARGDLSIVGQVRQLWGYRHLLGLWLRYTIQARYTQTTLGILWIVLLPLATALVLSLAFSQFLRIGRFAGNVPFLTFFLAGIVPYNIFNSGASKSTSAISGQIGIISRVYFPREILILLPMGEAIVDFMFTFVVFVAINGYFGHWPEFGYFLLLVPLAILVLMSLGIMFVISTWSMLVRDIPQLVGVVLQLLFYVTPILYPFESIPPNFRFLVLLNPLTPLIQAFRDVLIYGRGLDVVSLYYPLVISCGLLIAGFAFFKSREGVLSDLV